MTKEEILHLSKLARVALTDEEAAKLGDSITSILSYVSEIQSISGEAASGTLPPLRNVMREDEVTNEPGAFTESILSQAPRRHGQYIEVKKILSNDN